MKDNNDKSTGWAVLKLPTYVKEFAPMMEFAFEWFDEEDLNFIIKYNYKEGRLDFEARSDATQKQITISFEPGFPETMIHKDLWTKINLKVCNIIC